MPPLLRSQSALILSVTSSYTNFKTTNAPWVQAREAIAVQDLPEDDRHVPRRTFARIHDSTIRVQQGQNRVANVDRRQGQRYRSNDLEARGGLEPLGE